VLVRTVDASDDLAPVASLAALARPLAVDLLRELTTTGSFVATASESGPGAPVVGASVGFLTPSGLHSHLTVVAPGARRRGVATALKWHQREWALEAGLGSVTWTFDPADVGCARLSVSTLGAEITSYRRGFAADGTDRCVATWALRSALVTQAWHGVAAERSGWDRRCRPGAELADALDAGGHVVDVDGDGTYLVRGAA
jgi:predicted GNAT superfamily acetyltransferase